MLKRDYGDVIGGGVLVAGGVFITAYALASLNVGTVARMGPGMFPAALGVILSGLGLAIVLPACARAGARPDIDWRTLLAVSGAMLAFAVLVRPFGLAPAVIALTLIASRADSKLGWRATLTVALALALASGLIFQVGLGLQLPLLTWPW